jgi:hypothetical protein
MHRPSVSPGRDLEVDPRSLYPPLVILITVTVLPKYYTVVGGAITMSEPTDPLGLTTIQLTFANFGDSPKYDEGVKKCGIMHGRSLRRWSKTVWFCSNCGHRVGVRIQSNVTGTVVMH